MARTALRLSIDAEERTALEELSKVDGRPIHQLLDEAIKNYLRQRGQDGRTLESTLEALREYRTRDPEFQHAIDAFVAGEAGLPDPVEGEPIDGEFVEGQFKPAGPVQSRIRELLGA
jgi:hypothetical protein